MKRLESVLDRIDALHFLETNSIGTIASLNDERVPDLSSIYFFTHSDFSCYFVTKTLTRKYRNFLRRPTGTLLVFNEQELTSIEVQGEVQTVGDSIMVAQHIEQFQELVVSRCSGYYVPPIAQIQAGNYVVCRLAPTLIHFNKFTAGSYDTSPLQLTLHFDTESV